MNINKLRIVTTYKIETLDDLAEYFAEKASQCADRLANGKLMKADRRYQEGMHDAFDNASDILHNTVWDPGVEIKK